MDGTKRGARVREAGGERGRACGISLGGSGHRHDEAPPGRSHHLEGPVLNGEATAWDGGLSGQVKATGF